MQNTVSTSFDDGKVLRLRFQSQVHLWKMMMNNVFTVDDVKYDEEDGHRGTDNGQGDEHAAQEIFAGWTASSATSRRLLAVPRRVLRDRFH